MIDGASGCGLCPWSSSRKVGAYDGLNHLTMFINPKTDTIPSMFSNPVKQPASTDYQISFM